MHCNTQHYSASLCVQPSKPVLCFGSPQQPPSQKEHHFVLCQIHAEEQMQSKTVIRSGPSFGFLLPFLLSFLFCSISVFFCSFLYFSPSLVKPAIKKRHFLSIVLEKDPVSIELDSEPSSSHLWLHKGRKCFLLVVFLNCFMLVVNKWLSHDCGALYFRMPSLPP